MERSDDLQGEMTRLPFDDATVDRLLDGALAPDDAPPGLRHVAELVAAARRPAAEAEMQAKPLAVASLVSSVRVGAGIEDPRRKRSMLGKFATVKVLAIAGPIALLGAGTAAAATGSLPTPAQHAVSVALSHVDISVPDPHSHHGKGTSTSTSPNSGATGPQVTPTSPATFGLCTAFAAGGLNSHGVAYRNLAAAAAGASQSITAYCAPIIAAHSSNGSGSDNSSSSSNSNSSGGGSTDGGSENSSTQNGPPFTTPPVSTPAKGKPSTVPPAHP